MPSRRPTHTRGLFIAGTDTDAGKTFVAAGILRHLRVSLGVDAVPMKPVQTGCLGDEGAGWVAPDLVRSLAAAGLAPSAEELALMAPYCYGPACSPHLAARLSGRQPELAHVQQCAAQLLAAHACLIVEGAGGVLVPLNDRHTTLDLIAALGFPVLLVCRNALGCVNHALLSIAALRQAGATVAGVVMNETSACRADERFIRDDNPLAIAAYGHVPVLGRIPFRKGAVGWDTLSGDAPELAKVLDGLAASGARSEAPAAEAAPMLPAEAGTPTERARVPASTGRASGASAPQARSATTVRFDGERGQP